MGANLTAEQLSRLRSQVEGAASDLYAGAPLLIDGRYFQPQIATGNGALYEKSGTIAGFTSYPASWADASDHAGETFSVYGADGSYSHEEPWTKLGLFDPNLMLFLAVAGGLAFLPGGAVSTLTGSASSATAAGGSGAFLGEGVASGVPAWDLAATNAGLELTAGGFITETAAAQTAVKSASITKTLSGAASAATGLISTAAKAASTLLGIKSAFASDSGPGAGPVYVQGGAAPALLPGGNLTTMLFLAGAVGLVAFVATRK